MSASHKSEYHFLLDGTERLGAEYDEFADVLYLWRGEGPRPAGTVTSTEGHLVRIDLETAEVVGFTIFGWGGQLKRGTIEVTVPAIAQAQPDEEPSTTRSELRIHELIPA